jgi:hypothetical protein
MEMEILITKPKKYCTAVAILSVLLFVMTGCSKSAQYPTSTTNISSVAMVSVVHASPEMSAIDIAFDNNRLNLSFFNYADRVDYFKVYSGNRKFSVFREKNYEALFAKNMYLIPEKYYTIFIVDTLSKMDAVLLQDSSRAPGTDSVRIRFANMSPDLNSVDLYAQGFTAPIATKMNYKSASDFISIKAANDVVFTIRTSGTNSTIAASDKINLITGNFYTIWIAGFMASGANASTLKVSAIRQ